jgi:hypothetical protein
VEVTPARLFHFMDEYLYALMEDQSSIQNLDYLRQLIAETRGIQPFDDLERLRMFSGMGVGTDIATSEDR